MQVSQAGTQKAWLVFLLKSGGKLRKKLQKEMKQWCDFQILLQTIQGQHVHQAAPLHQDMAMVVVMQQVLRKVTIQSKRMTIVMMWRTMTMMLDMEMPFWMRILQKQLST